MACPTLGNGPAEETGSAGHRHERRHAHGTSRFAKDRDVMRVSSESGDVLLHPGGCSDLVEQAEVDNAVTPLEEAIGSQMLVDGDADDDIAVEWSAIICAHWPRS